MEGPNEINLESVPEENCETKSLATSHLDMNLLVNIS